MDQTTSTPLSLLTGINWDDPGSILTTATHIFDQLTQNPAELVTLLEQIHHDPHLQVMCERYDFVDKLVLHDTPDSRVRLRMHLYRPGDFERPHNHRWSFASRILRGRYLHRVYGRDDTFTENTDPDTLTPIYERFETTGSTYALHHTSVHTVQADADTVSLLLRGPAEKDRFLILDGIARNSFWVYGAAQETPEQRATKQMSPQQRAETINRAQSVVRNLGVSR